jgi:hypothetical protein
MLLNKKFDISLVDSFIEIFPELVIFVLVVNVGASGE